MRTGVVRFVMLLALTGLLAGCGAVETSSVSGEVKETEESRPEMTEEESQPEETEQESQSKPAEGKTQPKETEEQKAETTKTGYENPAKSFKFPYASDYSFDPDTMPQLLAVGNADEDTVAHVEEGIEDMLQFQFDTEEYFYGEASTQNVYVDESGKCRIEQAYVYTGDFEMDAIMNSVGYKEYYVTYYYTFGLWETDTNGMNAPIYVSMVIEGKNYEYTFWDNQLIKRVGPEGEQINPKTNEFINKLYKYGCYLGETLNKERGEYTLFLTNPDEQVKEENGVILLTPVTQGLSKEYTYVLDADTKFSYDCEREFFEGYEAGDSPLDWCKRALNNGEEYSTALTGVFVIRATGNHIDYLCGSYWWD